MTPGQEWFAWGGAFVAVILLCAFWPDEDRPRNKRRRRQTVPRMYINADPAPDSRSSLEQFAKTFPKKS